MKIEHDYEQSPSANAAKMAAQNFYDDYVKAMSGPKPNVARFENEWRQLLHDNSENHLADQVALIMESTSGQNPSESGQSTITRARAIANASDKDNALLKDVGFHVAQNFDNFAAVNSHGLHNFFAGLSAQPDGIQPSEVADRLQGLSDPKNSIVVRSAHLFLDHSAKLFKEIAGTGSAISTDNLQGALSDPHFNSEQKSVISYLVDHWDDPEVMALKSDTQLSGAGDGRYVGGVLKLDGLERAIAKT